MYTPQPPADSPIAQLMLAESRFVILAPDSGKDQIAQVFAEFREMLWQVIETSPDPAPYTNAWNMVNLHAKVDLLDFEQDNEAAQVKVQQQGKYAVELLP